jgi:hypothetical protein
MQGWSEEFTTEDTENTERPNSFLLFGVLGELRGEKLLCFRFAVRVNAC